MGGRKNYFFSSSVLSDFFFFLFCFLVVSVLSCANEKEMVPRAMPSPRVAMSSFFMCFDLLYRFFSTGLLLTAPAAACARSTANYFLSSVLFFFFFLDFFSFLAVVSCANENDTEPSARPRPRVNTKTLFIERVS